MTKLLFAAVLLTLPASAALAQSNTIFSKARYTSLSCDLFISAFKKQVKLMGAGGNETLSGCPGYEKYNGKNNKYKASADLMRAVKKPPAEVKKGGKGGKAVWKWLLLEGTPKEIAVDLLDEREFWALVEEFNKPRK